MNNRPEFYVKKNMFGLFKFYERSKLLTWCSIQAFYVINLCMHFARHVLSTGHAEYIFSTRKILTTREKFNHPKVGFSEFWSTKKVVEIDDTEMTGESVSSQQRQERSQISFKVKLFWIRWTKTTLVFFCHRFSMGYFTLWCFHLD